MTKYKPFNNYGLKFARYLADSLTKTTPTKWLVGRHGNEGYELHNNQNSEAQRVIIMLPIKDQLSIISWLFYRADKPELRFSERPTYKPLIVQRILSDLIP